MYLADSDHVYNSRNLHCTMPFAVGSAAILFSQKHYIYAFFSFSSVVVNGNF